MDAFYLLKASEEEKMQRFGGRIYVDSKEGSPPVSF